MRVLAFRHVPFEHLGLIAPSLASAGIQFDYLDLCENPETNVDVESAAGLIFMGGPMSANGDLAGIRAELAVIEKAVSCRKPVLGVCLGAQLIAKALGARVYRNPVKEVGWYPIWWTSAAGGDPLVAGLTGAETVFHWHGETFDLPAGAERLARSDACLNQAFRAGEDVYGFQFHLEVTPAMIVDWVSQDLNKGDVRELSSLPDPFANAERMHELSRTIFGRWAALAARKSGLLAE